MMIDFVHMRRANYFLWQGQPEAESWVPATYTRRDLEAGPPNVVMLFIRQPDRRWLIALSSLRGRRRFFCYQKRPRLAAASCSLSPERVPNAT